MKYILLQSEQSSRRFVGGKAASLLELKKNGFNIPPFFVLTTHLMNKLDDEVECRKFYPIIKKAYKTTIGKGKVAVRSSATIEDSRLSSFAGQFKTMLNVDINDVCNAIKIVYLSMPTVLATYGPKIKSGIKVKMAIIVQKMVDPEKAGVLFTVDPIEGDKNKIVVEVVTGFGEALVSGAKTPTRYYISRATNKILNHKKDKLMTTKELKQLCSIALSIEKLFKYPQDIEFAIKKDKIYILQSRDITTLS